MAQIGSSIERAATLLSEGKLVAIPTETVYGLAANALDSIAVASIFETKERPSFNPLIVHCANSSEAFSFCSEVPDLALRLSEAFWPGPLTLVLPGSSRIPAITRAGLETVGLRVPSHPLTQGLLEMLDFPLAAPSANPFGYISPTTAIHVQEQLGQKIDYILDGGSAGVGIESTIVYIEDDKYDILRQGGTEAEQLCLVSGQEPRYLPRSESKPLAPGMLSRHYAPRTSFRLIGNLTKELIQEIGDKRIGAIVLSQKHPDIPTKNQIVLSPHGHLREAAARLFAAMRELDSMELDFILAEKVPDEGLGKAINDRLARAASA